MNVMITGGSRGIGAAAVRAFSARGDRVAFLYEKEDEKAAAVAAETGAIAIRCDVSDEAAYSATKGAILALTKALAQELGPSGIRVNAVAPGVIQTDMCAHVDPAVMEGLRQQTPIERLGTPEDIARAMVYLADAEFITGQVLPVNGGFVIT